jgi:hypothetical protein
MIDMLCAYKVGARERRLCKLLSQHSMANYEYAGHAMTQVLLLPSGEVV